MRAYTVTHTHICICTHAQTHRHTRTHLHSRTHTRTHARTHAHTHARTHSLTHARMHARTHTHTLHDNTVWAATNRASTIEVTIFKQQLMHYGKWDEANIHMPRVTISQVLTPGRGLAGKRNLTTWKKFTNQLHLWREMHYMRHLVAEYCSWQPLKF